MATQESAVGRRKKKRTPGTITARVVCRPLFAYAILCHAVNVSQSDFTSAAQHLASDCDVVKKHGREIALFLP